MAQQLHTKLTECVQTPDWFWEDFFALFAILPDKDIFLQVYGEMFQLRVVYGESRHNWEREIWLLDRFSLEVGANNVSVQKMTRIKKYRTLSLERF
jgi:hypothetical protein